MSINVSQPFLGKVGQELKRAERYRIFLSLIVIDLEIVDALGNGNKAALLEGVVDLVLSHVREVDLAAVVERRKLALLLPETPRQGAEIAARRLAEMIRSELSNRLKMDVDQVIPLEMASYPDAAGTRSIQELLEDFTKLNMN